MNLQALYDLKERLEHAAIAGTGLLQEDFRLHRAVEALAPLADVNPVFAKISAAAKALLAAPQSQRGTRLLDVLSLVDAVVYTQGVSNVPGDLAPLEPGPGSYTEASYGQLQPLLTALGGTGSGRTAVIQNTWTEHPEYFGDFRVLPHVVNALAETYSELAEMIGQILMKQGESVIPMLKECFDPAGKTEMARRVRLVARLAGESENDWFTGILPDSKKDVREAVIQALSFSQDNAGLLLDLCRSERGKLKEAALRSLAMMEAPVCVEYLKKEIKKKKGNLSFLRGVSSTAAADLAAEAMQERLEALLDTNGAYDDKERNTLGVLAGVLIGKASPRMERFWKWAAQRMDRFAAMVPGKNTMDSDLSAAELLQKTFLHAVLWNPCPGMLELAHGLAEENREWFLCGGFLADLAVLPAGALYEKYALLIVRSGVLKRESAAERSDRIQIMRGLAAIRWHSGPHAYLVNAGGYDAVTGDKTAVARMLDGVDPRWMELLTDPGIQGDGAVYALNNCEYFRKAEPAMDLLISLLMDADNPEVCRRAGEWFYRWIRTTGQYGTHFFDLIQCGWKDWKGLLPHCIAMNGVGSYYNIMELIRQLPLSGAEKAEELRQIDLLVRGGKVKVMHGYWPQSMVAGQIAALEAEDNGGT